MPFISADLPPPPFVQFVPSRHEIAAPFSLIVKLLPMQATQYSIRLTGRGEQSLSLIQAIAKADKLSLLFKETPPIKPTPLATIIEIPPAVEEKKEIPYNELVCTEVDKLNIAYIIQTMSSNGKLSLLFKKSELKRIGAEINHVHPLKFLETIFANPDLKECMREIHRDYFKWNGFLDGLVPSLNSQSDQGKLTQHLKDFSARVNSTPESLTPYFESRDWENLIRYLTNN